MNRAKSFVGTLLLVGFSWWLAGKGNIVMAQDAFKIINEWKGFQCGIPKPSQLVIKDSKTWSDIWDKVHSHVSPKPKLPEVDFEKHMVLAVFMGTKPTGGYAIQIRGVRYDKQADKLVVTVEEKSPPPGSIVIQVITHPFHMVVVPKSDKPVQFETVGAVKLR